MTERAESEILSQGSRTNSLYTFIGVVVVILGAVAFAGQNYSQRKSSPPDVAVIDNTATRAEAGTIQMKGVNFTFSPSVITVQKGHTVKIILTSGDMPHDFVIDALGVRSSQVSQGESTEIEFTPDQVGEFEYYCSVGEHRAKGMIGKLIVRE